MLASHKGAGSSPIPAAPVVVQLPITVYRKATENGAGTWAPSSHTGDQEVALAPGFSWPSPGLCSHLKSEPAGEKSLFLSFSVSLPFKQAPNK